MLSNIRAINLISEEIIYFGEEYKIVHGLDLSGMPSTVSYSDSTFGGGDFQNSRIGVRPLSIEVQIRRMNRDEVSMEEARRLLYRVFSPYGSTVRMYFEDSQGNEYYLDGKPTSSPIMSPDKENDNAVYQRVLIEMICVDPFIYAAEGNGVVNVSAFDNLWSFPLNIPVEGMEFGSKRANYSTDYFLDTDIPIGVIANIAFIGPVNQVRIRNVDRNETLAVDATFDIGDKLYINTNPKRKQIQKIQGISVTNLMNKITASSKFPLIQTGNNTIVYAAGSGVENMVVQLEFQKRYLGV